MANRFLNNITINDEYTLPSVDGTVGQAIVTDGAGNLSFGTVAAGTSDAALKITLTVKNVSGGTLNAGTLVRVAPTANPPSGNVLEVDVADNSAASTMPAVGILIESIADEAEGDAVAFGRASGFSTSGYTEGDPIWVGSNGAFVGTKPTGTAFIQKVGQIIKVHASNGSIEVFGAGRSNDVPNIPQDQLWLGNSSGVATPTAHTVENISNVTVSSKTDGQALVWDATNNYWKNGNVASGGSGGGAELSIERNVFTATADQTAFTISSEITASSNTQVYIDGVYQAKSNYTTSGSTITFSTGVPLGAEVEVVHFISVLSKVYTDTFTGNASTVNFTASKDVTDENVTQVYIDGVYQSKDNYTTSGTTITFSTAPPSGSAIEVVHFTPATYSTLNSNQFTGTGSQTDFTLTQAVDVDTSFVFVQGVYQEKDTYSISGTTLTFTTAPLSGYSIEVITVGAVANVTSSPVNSVNGLTGDVTVSGGTDWQATPKTANFTAVAGEGYFVDTTSSAITVTLPAGTVGTEIVIQDYAGTFATNGVTIVANGSEKIQGDSTNNFRCSINNATVNLVYQDIIKGWTADNIEKYTNISWGIASGQSLVYTSITPQTSAGLAGDPFPSTTFTITSSNSAATLSGTASISGLPTGITYSQSYNNTNPGNILTITLAGVFPSTNASNINLTISNLIETAGLNIDYMLLGGGGGGGEGSVRGGGGAGGLYSDTSQLVATSLTISIGAGGGQGGGSQSTISGDFSATAGGGSGGAGGGAGGASGSGSSGYPSNPGGTQYVVGGTTTYQDGGGGGVGGPGSNGSTSQGVGADGGIGTNDFSTWAAATSSGESGYFGGGGGAMGWWRSTTNTCSTWNCNTGNGGLGGGGNGTAYGVATVASDCNGAANTGGGGGNYGTGSQPLGGSGICIIRYSGSQAATGGTITTTGGYTYHKFTSSGTFTIT